MEREKEGKNKTDNENQKHMEKEENKGVETYILGQRYMNEKDQD